MSRHNQIPLRMKVEGLRLTPASAFDQEALSSYQNGAVLQVFLWQGRNPDLLRKFWAIISKVVETCNTPWEDKEEAADALKLALGITDVGSTVNGQMFVRPGSISFAAMDEGRFRKFFDDAMALLSRITGVDVVELGREAADTGPDHDPTTGEIYDTNTNSGSPSKPDADAPAPDSAPAEEGSVLSPAESSSPNSDATDSVGEPASDSASGGGTPPLTPSPEAARDPETEILIRFANDILPMAADTSVSASALAAVEKEWATELSKLSDAGKDRARAISKSMRAIANGSTSLESAVEFFSEALGCEPAEIGGVNG